MTQQDRVLEKIRNRRRPAAQSYPLAATPAAELYLVATKV